MYERAKIKQLVNAQALLISSKTTLLSTMFDLQFRGGGGGGVGQVMGDVMNNHNN